MTEENKRVCKKCGVLKLRILSGKFDLYNKKWTDETGKLWNGSTCPQCHLEKTRENMKKLRSGYGTA